MRRVMNTVMYMYFNWCMFLVYNVKTTTFWKWFLSPGGEISTVLGLLVELLKYLDLPQRGISLHKDKNRMCFRNAVVFM
jgi:hypothetical protein